MRNRPLMAAALAIAVLAAMAPGAGAARACSGGKAAWKVEGRTLCVKQTRVRAEGSTAPAVEAVRRWMRASSNGSGGRMRVPRRLLRAVPAAERAAARLTGAALGPRASRAGGFDLRVPTVRLPGGVTVSSRARLERHPDRAVDAELEIEAVAPNGERVIWRPVARDLRSRGEDVGCPTGDGRVSSVDVETVGGTTTVLRGRRVIAARTIRERIETKRAGSGPTPACARSS
jgi:hypothetical protein